MFTTVLELLNFNAPGEWKIDGDTYVKRFLIDDEQYEILVTIDDSLIEPFGRLNFTHIKDGISSLDLTGINKNTSKIFGTIINSCKEKFSHLGGMIFFAKEPERISLYHRLARRAQMDLHMNLEAAETNGTTVFALTRSGSSLRLSDFIEGI